MSILLFASAVAPCRRCADSFVDTPYVALGRESTGYIARRNTGSRGVVGRFKKNLVYGGYHGPGLASGQSAGKEQRCHS